MGSSIILGTRELIADMMDRNGKYYESPRGSLRDRHFEKRRLDFLYDYVDFVLNSACLCEFTKQYLCGFGSVRGFAESYNSSLKDKQKGINQHSAQSKIYYDKSKLEKLFSKTMIKDVLYLNNDINTYEEKLVIARIQYTKWGSLRSNLTIKIPRDYMNGDFSDQEFNEFIQTIAPYTKGFMEDVEKSISREAAGYFNFLVSGKNLKGTDLERFNRLKELLEDGDR